MPNILVHLPGNSFPGNARSDLVRRINEAAARAEQIPADPRHRMLCWIMVEEIDAGAWTCGGADLTGQMLPCMAIVHVPSGVLDETSRTTYAEAMHDAFRRSMPMEDKRTLVTSVLLQDVADGAWGVNGTIWTLPAFAKAAGFSHLRHLAAP